MQYGTVLPNLNRKSKKALRLCLRFRFPSPVLRVQFNPRRATELLVVPMRHAAVLISLEGGHRLVPVEDDTDLAIYACYDR